MFHATAMVPDYDAAVARLGELIGLRVLEYSAIGDPAIGRRGGMCWIGDGSLELAAPIVPGAPPDRFVKRTGGGMQGVALWVDDLAATVAHLDAARAALTGAGVGVLRDAHDCLLVDPRATGRVEVAVVDRLLPGDPRS